ncbi:MAG: serine hydrolase domain-containing protein [Nocardioides sp.]
MPQSRPEELTLSNWDLGGPISAWSYAHADQLFPTLPLFPGRAPVGLAGSSRTVPAAVVRELESGLVESAVVLLHGQVAHSGPSVAGRPRLLMSVTKVIASLIIGILADRGDVDYDQPIGRYVARLGPQWEGCRLVDVLDMASGVVCPEVGDPGSYLDPQHPFFQFEASLGWRPATKADSPFDLVSSYDRVGEPGAELAYTSVNTFLLAWVVETVTDLSYIEAVQQLVWDQLALTDRAAWTVNHSGTAVAHGGLIMTTEDLARLATVFTPSGRALGHGLAVPASYTDMLHEPRNLRTPWTPEGAWPAGQWNWITPDGDMFKSGFGGQGVFISPSRDIVIAFTGTPGIGGTTNRLGELCQDWASSLAQQQHGQSLPEDPLRLAPSTLTGAERLPHHDG